jgi:hypothetical protein
MLMRRAISIFTFLLCSVILAEGQSTDESLIQQINDDLTSVRNLPFDSMRIEVGKRVTGKLSQLLSSVTSFTGDYHFKYIGKISSPDGKFNIYSFNIPLLDATHQFFGIIQLAPQKGRCNTFVLNDISKEYSARPVFEKFTPDRWYGSLYYEIIPVRCDGKVIYTLIGSCLNNSLFTNKKIIESLYFDETGNPEFGLPVFDYGLKHQCRIIFEFTIMAQMSIHYNKKMKMIVFDHLSPSSPLYTNNYKFYGPDASYDGLRFEDCLWKYLPNVFVH